jgi:hypothetical protein
VDPDQQPVENSLSRREVAMIINDLDGRSARDGERVLADLLWLAWPSVRSQDQ